MHLIYHTLTSVNCAGTTIVFAIYLITIHSQSISVLTTILSVLTASEGVCYEHMLTLCESLR